MKGSFLNRYLFPFFQGYFLYSNLFYPQIYLQPRSTNSLPHSRRQSRSRHRKTALSMYSSPQFIHRTSPYRSYYRPTTYQSHLSPVSSQASVCYENEPNASRMCGYDSFASSVVTNHCSSPSKKFSSNMYFTNMKGNYTPHEFDCSDINGNLMQYSDNRNGEYSNSKGNEPIYDDIKQTYDCVENIIIPQRCSTIIEEFYGEV